MDKFQNKYRIPSARASWWDYGAEAAYFITICTKDRAHFFGEIINENDNRDVESRCIASLRATEIGKIVEMEWLKTPGIRPDMNLELRAFVVMPNHFHAVIIIGQNEYNGGGNGDGRDAMHRVSTSSGIFAPQSKNLASIMRGFKSAVTQYARINQIKFDWQPRFQDHIIRDERAYDTISNYIVNNPANWDKDKFR